LVQGETFKKGEGYYNKQYRVMYQVFDMKKSWTPAKVIPAKAGMTEKNSTFFFYFLLCPSAGHGVDRKKKRLNDFQCTILLPYLLLG